MPEYTVKAGTSPFSPFMGFNYPSGGGLSTTTVDRSQKGDAPKVVIYPDASGSGVELDSTLSSNDLSAAINSIRFGKPVSPNAFRQAAPTALPKLTEDKQETKEEPVIQITPEPVFVHSPSPTPPPPAPVLSQTLANVIEVTFEKENGDTFVSCYSEVVDDGKFLTLIYDHDAKPGVLYRPGASDETIYINVNDSVYACYSTGYRVRFRNHELIAFVIEETKNTHGQE